MPDGSVPVDPDLPALRRRAAHWDIIAVVAAGGMIGATGRYALSLALPTEPGRFPWGTFLTNVSGAAVLGLLLVLLTERYESGRYLRPFLGTGVMGAYTTFSTFMVEADLLVRDGHPVLALSYLVGSLLAGAVAVWLGMRVGRRLPVRPKASR